MVKRRQRRKSWRRRLLKLTGLLVIAVLVGLIVAVSQFDKNMFDQVLADRLEDALGRRLDIDGTLNVSLSLAPEITATDVKLKNASWASDEDMLVISKLDATVQLWPLLSGNLVFDKLDMEQVDANLEMSSDGEANWNLETSDNGSGGGMSVTLPDDLSITRLNVKFDDKAAGDSLNGWFDDVHLASSANNLDITTTGQVDDTPVTIDLNLPSLEAVIDPDLDTPVKGNVVALGVTLTIDGHVGLGHDGTASGSADITIDSDDISSLSPLAGVQLPAQPLQFTGTANVTGDQIVAKGDATLTDTTAKLDVTIGTDVSPPSASGSVSISGDDPTWIAKLATIDLPSESYALDASFSLDDKLQASGSGKLGETDITFEMTDATWDGIPPQAVKLSLSGPDMSRLGDWLDIEMPATAFTMSLKGTETNGAFVVTDGVAASGSANATFGATIANLDDPLSVPLPLQVTTDNLQAIGNLYDIDLPALPFTMSTNLIEKDSDNYTLSSLKAVIDKQELAGSLDIDDSGGRTAFSGSLSTDDLDVADIADAMGANDLAEDEPLIIPDPGIDLDVTLQTTKVSYEDLEFQNAHLRIRTDDREVGLYGLTALFASGKLTSDFKIAHSVTNPPIDGTLKLVDASTTDISTMFDLPGDVRGPLNIDIEADSDIADVNQTLKDVTGHADIVLQNGYVGSDVLRKADSFVNLLAPWRDKKDPSVISCLVLRYDLTDGKATSEVTLLDTTTMTVAGSGSIDMLNETINLRLAPTPKDATLLSLASAVKITGPLDDPSLSVGPLDVATGVGGSLLSSILAPVKALMPILGITDDNDSPCKAALDPNRGASNAAQPVASNCARPQPWTDNGHVRFGRHTQHTVTCPSSS